jgi:hypothetical protein
MGRHRYESISFEWGSIMSDIATEHRRMRRDEPRWSGDDCIEVTLIWLRLHRDKLTDAIEKIEAVRPQQTPGA